MERTVHPNYRFKVIILHLGVVPDLWLDIRFQRVSGMNVNIETENLHEGGENLCTLKLPTRVNYDNLVLERGLVVGSPLNVEFSLAMSDLALVPNNIFVTLLDNEGNTVLGASWLFKGAYPVRWEVSDMDATSNNIMIDTMEFAHNGFTTFRI